MSAMYFRLLLISLVQTCTYQEAPAASLEFHNQVSEKVSVSCEKASMFNNRKSFNLDPGESGGWSWMLVLPWTDVWCNIESPTRRAHRPFWKNWDDNGEDVRWFIEETGFKMRGRKVVGGSGMYILKTYPWDHIQTPHPSSSTITLIHPPTNWTTEDNKVRFSWESVPGATSYTLNIEQHENTGWARSRQNTTTTDITADLPQWNEGRDLTSPYYWQITARLQSNTTITSERRPLSYKILPSKTPF